MSDVRDNDEDQASGGEAGPSNAGWDAAGVMMVLRAAVLTSWGVGLL